MTEANEETVLSALHNTEIPAEFSVFMQKLTPVFGFCMKFPVAICVAWDHFLSQLFN